MESREVERYCSSPGFARACRAQPGRRKAGIGRLKSPAEAGQKGSLRGGESFSAKGLVLRHSDTLPGRWPVGCVHLSSGVVPPPGCSTTTTTTPLIARIIAPTIARIIRIGAPRLSGDVARYLSTVSLTRRSAGLPAFTCLFKAGRNSIFSAVSFAERKLRTRGEPGLVDAGALKFSPLQANGRGSQ